VAFPDTTINIKPFLKNEEGNPFYLVPSKSDPLFPQFKGIKPLGVTRAKNQTGELCLSLLCC
jgi:hypothetical protein